MTQHASYMAGNSYAPADMMQRENDWVNPGVVSLSDLVVTAGAGLTVSVSGAAQGSIGGNAWLPGGYRFYNDAAATVTLATADPTNPRIDLIVVGIDTTQNPYLATVTSVTGTPAASPVAPSMAGTFVGIILAQVAVAANATTISAGNITDMRAVSSLKTKTEIARFSASGTFTVPAGINNIDVYVVGGGGGGGVQAGGGGGGGGGYCSLYKNVPVTPGIGDSVVIGAGGGAGSNGGQSYFNNTNYAANGGSAGAISGGNGGSGGGGGNGNAGFNSGGSAGSGSGTMGVGGGNTLYTPVNPHDGIAYGCGGGGGVGGGVGGGGGGCGGWGGANGGGVGHNAVGNGGGGGGASGATIAFAGGTGGTGGGGGGGGNAGGSAGGAGGAGGSGIIIIYA